MQRYLSIFLTIILFQPLFAKDISLNVPYVAQEKNGCGAAAISMVLSYWNENGYPVDAKTRNADEILKQLYSKEYSGIRARDIEQYFQEQHYTAIAFRGSIRDLAHHLSKGRPLVVALHQNGSNSLHHYVVATGISSDQSIVIINDPAQRKLLKTHREEFEKAWKDVDYWTLLAVPKTTS